MRQIVGVQSQAAEGRSKKLIEALLHTTDISPEAESALMKQIKRFGGQTPDFIANKPKLAPGLQFFFDAFYDLDTERSLADMAPIPWSKIKDYGEYHKLGEEGISDLLYLIREADNAYLSRVCEKRKRG